MYIELKQQIKNEILEILLQSPVPEDYEHALNVLEWVMRLKPEADLALQIAALSHDMERALPARKVLRANYSTYDAFKWAHSKNSTKIVAELLAKYPLEKECVEKVKSLIQYHEFGKKDEPDLLVLKDADSLSFFEINLPHYFRREGEKETFSRMQWGYHRLSEKAKPYLKHLIYDEDILNKLLQKIIEAGSK